MDIALGILTGFFIDMVMTYLILDTYKKTVPDKDFTRVEQNPILRMCIKKLGLNKGMFLGIIFLFVLLNLALKFIFRTENWRYFLFGIYCMQIIFHYLNLNALMKAKGVKLFKIGGID